MIHIGADTHKEEHAVVVLKDGAKEVGRRKMKNSVDEYTKILEWAKQWDAKRLWGIENTGSYGKLLAEYLIEQGEVVYEIPANLTARQRRLGLKKNKTDFQDALSIARNLYIEQDSLTPLKINQENQILRLLTHERETLITDRTECYNRLHRDLMYIEPRYKELIGDFKKEKYFKKCEDFLNNHTGKGTSVFYCQRGLRLLEQIELLNKQIDALTNQLKERIEKINSPLTSMKGIGIIRAAELLGEIGDINRFKSSAQLAKLSGIAPLEVSSGRKNGHRVNSGGNRRLNKTFHGIALTQARYNPVAKAYFERKLQEGKTKKMARRCLKRKLVDIVFAMLRDNQEYKSPPQIPEIPDIPTLQQVA